MSMRFKTACAEFTSPDTADNARRATEKIKSDFAGGDPALVIFFSSMDYDPETIARSMRDAFPSSLTVGCTSSGEGIDGKLLRHNVTAMAFSRDVFSHCEFAVVPQNGLADTSAREFTSVDAALRAISQTVAVSPLSLDYREYVGFVLSSTPNSFTERVLERVGELTNVMFIGGVAGDDFQFSPASRAFYNGKSYPDACVIALWKPVRGFSLLKTQAAEVRDRTFTVTKAGGNVIWEFDGRPAAEVYAAAIGFSPAEINKMTLADFSANPLALTVEGEPFLRPVLSLVDGTGLSTSSTSQEGLRLTLTRTVGLAETTRVAVEKKLREMKDAGGEAAAILHINCALRCMMLKGEKEAADFASIFASLPCLSFASYGEIYVGMVAITSTMIFFK